EGGAAELHTLTGERRAQPGHEPPLGRGGLGEVGARVDRPAGLQHEHLQARLAELLRRPASGGAGPDHHRVVDQLALSTVLTLAAAICSTCSAVRSGLTSTWIARRSSSTVLGQRSSG